MSTPRINNTQQKILINLAVNGPLFDDEVATAVGMQRVGPATRSLTKLWRDNLVNRSIDGKMNYEVINTITQKGRYVLNAIDAQ